MGTIILMAAMVATGACTELDTLENAHMRAVITPGLYGVRAGSLLELVDKQTGVDLADGRQFGGIQCEEFIPQDGLLELHSPTQATFTSPGLIDYGSGDELPIALSIDYVLAGRGLDVTICVTSTDEAELEHPLEVDFSAQYFDTVSFGNQSTSCERVAALDGTHGLLRVSGDQEVGLRRANSDLEARWLFPNPAKAVIAVNDFAGKARFVSLRMFDTEPPRENCAGPDLHSLLGAGSSSRYHARLTLNPQERPSYISAHPDGYERTASWILDELPFVHPGQGYIWGYSVTPDGDEIVSALLIQLLQDHPTMVMNWLLIGDLILEANCDSMWYEPGYEDSWSHWHSTWRVSTLATPEYRQWLLNIHNDIYSWADRVRIGCHGYHHTPSPDSAWDPYHEFITYEPEEHVERFAVIQEDLLNIGFESGQTLRTIRYPGHRTSLSGLWATIGSGFRFYCNGVRWWEDMGGEPFWDQYLSKYETPEGRIWGSNTVWWGDYAGQCPYEYLTTVMDRGKHALLGSHPIAMWAGGQPYAYDRIDSLCTSLEEEHEHFGWLFPEEYGLFLEECYQVGVDSLRSGNGWNRLYFTGSTSRGQYALCRIPEGVTPDYARINSVGVPWELRDGGRVFVDIEGLGWDNHVLEVAWTPEGLEDEEESGPDLRMSCRNPTAGRTQVIVGGAGGVPVTIGLYDLSGRKQLTRQAAGSGSGGRATASLDLSGLPAGIYILTARTDQRMTTAKLVLLRQ